MAQAADARVAVPRRGHLFHQRSEAALDHVVPALVRTLLLARKAHDIEPLLRTGQGDIEQAAVFVSGGLPAGLARLGDRGTIFLGTGAPADCRP